MTTRRSFLKKIALVPVAAAISVDLMFGRVEDVVPFIEEPVFIDFIEQTKLINRMITLLDFQIGAHAKGWISNELETLP